MASIADLGANSHFIGGHLAFTSDENRGGIGLLAKRTKEQGGTNIWESLSSASPFSVTQTWKNKRERVTVANTFKRGAPRDDSIVLNVPIHGLIPATGQICFVNPTSGRSYVITEITEAHTVLEATAAEANMQVVIMRGTSAASAGQELLAALEIDVETSGIAINTVTYADLEASSESQRTVRPGDRIGFLFQDNAGTTDVIGTEYRGHLTITMKPVVEDNESDVLVTFHTTADEVLATTGVTLFTAIHSRMQVVGIEEVHGAAETSAATLNMKVERCQGTEAATGGDDLVTATGLDLKATANTTQTATVQTGSAIDILEVGDRLVMHGALDNATAQASTEYDGCVTIRLRPVVPGICEERYVSFMYYGSLSMATTGITGFIADQEYRLTHASEAHTVIETGVAAPSAMLERLQGTEAVAAGNLLLTAQAVDLDATINTIQDPTIVTGSQVDILATGDRLVGYMTDDGASDAAVASTDCAGCITVRLEATTGPGTLNLGQIYQADSKAYELTSVEATWGTLERTQPTLNLQAERLQGTEAPDAGDLLLGATNIPVTGTINTVNAGTVVSSGNEVLANGDRLNLLLQNDTGQQAPAGELDDITVTCKLLGQTDGIEPAKEGVIFTAVGRSFKLVNVEATWETAEVTGTQTNLMLERLQGTEAAGGASGGNGDALIGATNIDLTGTVATVNTGTVVTASSVDVIADGNRIALQFVNDAGTTTIVPTELDGLQVTLYLTPVTLEAFATS